MATTFTPPLADWKRTMTEMTEMLFLNLGARVGSDGKMIIGLLLVTQQDIDAGVLPDTERGFWGGKGGRALGKGQAGSVYRVEGEHTEEGGHSIVTKGARFHCLWPDEEERLSLSVEDRTARCELDRRSREAKMAPELHEVLKPIRGIYRSQVGRNKAAMLAEIIRYVTG